jgi:hypothetical protein
VLCAIPARSHGSYVCERTIGLCNRRATIHPANCCY